MKRVIPLSLMMAVMSLFLSIPEASAQMSDEGPNLKETKVWSVEYIRTKPGKSDEYKKYLAKHYMSMMQAAKDKGIINDYILLNAMPGDEEDWDMMILVAVNKYADMDNMSERFDQLRKEMLGDKEKEMMKETEKRYAMRDIMGGKMARQLVLDK